MRESSSPYTQWGMATDGYDQCLAKDALHMRAKSDSIKYIHRRLVTLSNTECIHWKTNSLYAQRCAVSHTSQFCRAYVFTTYCVVSCQDDCMYLICRYSCKGHKPAEHNVYTVPLRWHYACLLYTMCPFWSFAEPIYTVPFHGVPLNDMGFLWWSALKQQDFGI